MAATDCAADGDHAEAQHVSSTSSPLEEALQSLRRVIHGSVEVPDASQPGPPPVWNALLKGDTPVFKAGAPACYVTAKSKADVVAAANFALRHGMRVAARGESSLAASPGRRHAV